VPGSTASPAVGRNGGGPALAARRSRFRDPATWLFRPGAGRWTHTGGERVDDERRAIRPVLVRLPQRPAACRHPVRPGPPRSGRAAAACLRDQGPGQARKNFTARSAVLRGLREATKERLLRAAERRHAGARPVTANHARKRDCRVDESCDGSRCRCENPAPLRRFAGSPALSRLLPLSSQPLQMRLAQRSRGISNAIALRFGNTELMANPPCHSEVQRPEFVAYPGESRFS